MEAQRRFITQLRVRYAETDQMRVVYHANYFVWMEIGRVEMLRSLGFNYKDLEETDGLVLAVIEANCKYLRAARYDEEITIETAVVASTSRVVEFSYDISSAASHKPVAKGSTRHMWLNREWKPTHLPEKYLSIIKPRK